jgi:hypothetical protein
MPLAARVAHARLLLAAGRFPGEISGQPMVDPGRSDVEDCYGGGLDGRWWLMSENRRLEASVADENRGPFPARWGGENDENHQVFSLQQGRNLSVVVRRLETSGKWRSDERERASPARGERESEKCYGVNALMVQRCSRRLWTVGSQLNWSYGCDWLDLQVIGRSGWSECLSGVTRRTEISVHRITWRNGIKT